MSKKAWLLFFLTLVFSFLFYDRLAGLNFLLFSAFVVFSLIIIDPAKLKDHRWIFFTSLFLLSGVFVFVHDSSLAILSYCISLAFLAAYHSRSSTAVITGLLQSAWSIGGSVVFIVLSLIKLYRKNQQAVHEGKEESKFRPGVILISFCIVLIFFLLYKSINPLFDKYTDSFSPEIGMVFFTVSGLLLLYGIIYFESFKFLQKWESAQSERLLREENVSVSSREIQAALIIFSLLDLMLIFIDALDLNYLYLGAGMPKGITHKEFVHHGVGNLVFSIAMGISITLWFFRGELSFNEKNKTVKGLVILWICLNLFMVLSTFFRNKMYTDDALLTYKRIGVYYWLLICSLLLFTTLIKITRNKSIWYILKMNSFFALVILVFSSAVDWDKLITGYNIKNSGSVASLDKRYLLSLSEGNISQLFELEKKPGFNVDSSFHYYFLQWQPSSAVLDMKLYDFLKKDDHDWRSFSLRRSRVREEIEGLTMTLDSLDLSADYISSMKPVFGFYKIRTLKLNGFDPIVYTELKNFPSMQSLSLSYLNRYEVPYIEKMNPIDTIQFDLSNKKLFDSLTGLVPQTKLICLKFEQEK